jgi:hypothetical protein
MMGDRGHHDGGDLRCPPFNDSPTAPVQVTVCEKIRTSAGNWQAGGNAYFRKQIRQIRLYERKSDVIGLIYSD